MRASIVTVSEIVLRGQKDPTPLHLRGESSNVNTKFTMDQGYDPFPRFPMSLHIWGGEDSFETSLYFYINGSPRNLRFNFLEKKKRKWFTYLNV